MKIFKFKLMTVFLFVTILLQQSNSYAFFGSTQAQKSIYKNIFDKKQLELTIKKICEKKYLILSGVAAVPVLLVAFVIFKNLYKKTLGDPKDPKKPSDPINPEKPNTQINPNVQPAPKAVKPVEVPTGKPAVPGVTPEKKPVVGVQPVSVPEVKKEDPKTQVIELKTEELNSVKPPRPKKSKDGQKKKPLHIKVETQDLNNFLEEHGIKGSVVTKKDETIVVEQPKVEKNTLEKKKEKEETNELNKFIKEETDDIDSDDEDLE